VLDPLICTVDDELRGGELAAVIGAQHLELEAGLLFRSNLYKLDGIYSCRLHWKDGPHEPRSIIHQQQEVVSTSWCRRCDRAAEITVDKVELLQRDTKAVEEKAAACA
jgi:hypothetical protein